ncbi:SMP-30/gluconolactonase/LRE family protein, partial [Streptomyces galilaeus]|uniref:SMP-30/gluconolactonase/LRE family protein n=1 Tax=Streptomyces galilaeus TaxID=33899 RepID=UPI0038F60E6E
GVPDGSAMDCDGVLWNCRYFGGGIVRVARDGTVLDLVSLPVRNVTTCIFGGDDLKTLYITTAANEADPADRLAGSLFALPVAVPGLPPTR